MVILFDKPSERAQGGYDDFMKKNKTFTDQFFTLDVTSLEESYPNDLAKKSNGELILKDKIKLANKIGDEITKEYFESSMETVFKSLEKAWELAFN